MGKLSEIGLFFLSSKIEKGKKDTDEICSGVYDRQHSRKTVPAKCGEAKIEQESKKMDKTEKEAELRVNTL